MDPHIYTKMRDTEDRHWWFVGRRRILHSVLKTLPLSPESLILDIGCGTGGNLATYKKFARLEAMEFNDQARQLAQARDICQVQPGHLPDALPFADNSADLIALTDVLEHVEDDLASLKAMKARLKAGGRILLTVPAHQFLWSQHDVDLHHKRRYSRRSLIAVANQAGFKISYIGYFNFWLFPLIAGVRFLQYLLPIKLNDHEAPAPFVNGILKSIFSSEGRLIPQLRLPFGVSLIAVLEK